VKFFIQAILTMLLLATANANDNESSATIPLSSTVNELQTPADDNNEPALGIRELLDTESLSQYWTTSLDTLMEKHALSTTFLGKGIASACMVLIAFILYIVLKRIIKNLILKAVNLAKVKIGSERIALYTSVYINILLVAIILSLFLVLTGVWIENAQSSFIYQKLSDAVQFVSTISILFILGTLTFESVSNLADRFFTRLGRTESARLQTLLPIARNAINVSIFLLFGITFISELGINIMPLLAGAGVIGFAIGFGAQTLVKDVITGFIIIFEDLVQIGDVVTVGGKSGLVEKITIRKIQLRSLDGVVSTIPFSEISIVENMTKEYSYYLFNIGIAYRESPDDVIEVLRGIGAEMQADSDFKNVILEPIEILGVDAFADSAIIIKARIKTAPIMQWSVGREFNRRMKYRFDEAGIEIPFPHRTIYFGEDKDGRSPSANICLKTEKSANDANAETT